MFKLVTILLLICLVIIGLKFLMESIKHTNLSSHHKNMSNEEDILIFNELKKVAIKRAAVENITVLAEQMTQIKLCDDKIIDLSKRIQKKAG